jgi:hypothetical protein
MPPWSALPPHLDSPEEWAGKDDDKHWYTSWRKQVKGWFAFGPRATERWARWRLTPRVLLAIKGFGSWRLEDDTTWQLLKSQRRVLTFTRGWGRWYLSRVQYYCAWHVQLQWPLYVGFHCGDWQGYAGFKRDADRVYWLALYFGRVWK